MSDDAKPIDAVPVTDTDVDETDDDFEDPAEEAVALLTAAMHLMDYLSDETLMVDIRESHLDAMQGLSEQIREFLDRFEG